MTEILRVADQLAWVGAPHRVVALKLTAPYTPMVLNGIAAALIYRSATAELSAAQVETLADEHGVSATEAWQIVSELTHLQMLSAS